MLDGLPYIECPLCVLLVDYNSTPDLQTCSHRTCLECMQRYLQTEINHSRLRITCPICSEPLQQQVIREILNDDKFYFKYESFMLRKVLAAEPDARWCPAPDCGYAVLATGCASCPRLVCQRDGCKTEFCYHCKQEWHPNQTCSAASIQRNKRNGLLMNAFNISDLISSADETDSNSTSEHEGDLAANNNGESTTHKAHRSKSRYDATRRKTARKSSSLPVTVVANSSSLRPEDIKECPVCSSRIIKMNDGSCNHMTCSICETNFCWLCMKEISDLHYFSPSGCTFWGKKPWSRKKKLLWRLGMLVGAPICIVFIAGIAVPAIVIGIPVWAARKLHTRLEKKQFSRYRKNAIITCGVLLSFVVSPIISAMALAVGIPILLGYVYGVVPLSLCRSSGGCLSSNPSVENLNELNHQQLQQQSAIVTSSSSASSSVVNQARNQLQRLQIQKAQQEYKRQQAKSEQHQLQLQQKSPFSTLTSSKATSSGSQATSLQYGNSASVDTATGVIEEYGKSIEVRSNHSNHGNAVTTGDGDGVCNNAGISVGGGSIGEPSLYTSNISLETTSIGNVTNIVERCSRNSTSGGVGCNLSSAGYGEDLETASNKALSGSILSHKIAEDAHSTKALAGSIISKESGGYTLIPVDVPESARATVSSLQTVANEQQIATT